MIKSQQSGSVPLAQQAPTVNLQSSTLPATVASQIDMTAMMNMIMMIMMMAMMMKMIDKVTVTM